RARPPWHFEMEHAHAALTAQFGVRDLKGFGCDPYPLAIAAAGCLLEYARETQRAALPHLQPPRVELPDDASVIDATSRRHLEIETSLAGRREHTLAWVMDHTRNPMGSRMLRRWLNRPLRDHALLRRRQHAIGALLDGRGHRAVQDHLRTIGDVERALARIAL